MTVVFFNRQGQVVELKRLKEIPTPELVLELGKQHRPGAFRLVPKGEYDASEFDMWVADALEAMDLAEQGKLLPGANTFGP